GCLQHLGGAHRPQAGHHGLAEQRVVVHHHGGERFRPVNGDAVCCAVGDGHVRPLSSHIVAYHGRPPALAPGGATDHPAPPPPVPRAVPVVDRALGLGWDRQVGAVLTRTPFGVFYGDAPAPCLAFRKTRTRAPGLHDSAPDKLRSQGESSMRRRVKMLLAALLLVIGGVAGTGALAPRTPGGPPPPPPAPPAP